MDDLITICIPTYRRPGLLLYCIASCLAQNYRPLEIDIGDNSPDDDNDSERLVASIVLPQGITLRYLRNRPAGNVADNLNALFAAARGRRLVVMNDDDALLPGAVLAMADAFGMANDVVAAYGTVERITSEGLPAERETRIHNIQANRIPAHAGLRRDPLVCAFWRQIPPVGFLIESEAARTVSYRDPSEIGLPADTDFGVRLGLAYRTRSFAFVPRPTVQYRLPSPDGMTAKAAVSIRLELYDLAAALDGLSPEEFVARDWMLRRLAHSAVVAHLVGGRRRAALRILFSRYYPYSEGVLRPMYAFGLLATPTLVLTLRSLARFKLSSGPAIPPPDPATMPSSSTSATPVATA